MQITINVDDQSGQLTVEADGQQPYSCESPEECLEYVEGLLMGGAEADEQAMWDQEAAKRPPMMG